MAYVLLLALIAVGVPLALSLRQRVDAEVRGQAASQAAVVATSAADGLQTGDSQTLQRLAVRSSRSVGGRVLIVDERGVVMADSDPRGPLGADYGSRPEIAAALRGRTVQETRDSETLGIEILATAAPVVSGGRPVGAVRVTQSVEAVNAAVQRSTGALVILGSVVLLLGLVAGALLASGIARPIHRLEIAARRVSEGDLTAKAAVEGSVEQQALAKSFNEMTARISRLLQSQRHFVADASHQLRTPLAGVRLRLEELRETTNDPKMAAELDAGMHEVDRLAQIVDELLILSRAGEHEAPAESVRLADAVARAAERWQKTAGERLIDLDVTAADDATSWCAQSDLDRAIDALLENAINYSAPGETISLTADGPRIEILDRGPGLAPGEAEQVFRRFFRGRAGRQCADGTGLGLPIARELIEQWGGSVEIVNREGGGACAIITLPPKLTNLKS